MAPGRAIGPDDVTGLVTTERIKSMTFEVEEAV